MFIHPKLTGRLQYCSSQEKKKAATVVIWRFENGFELRYLDEKLNGQIWLIQEQDYSAIPRLLRCGPDSFSLMLTLALFKSRLKPFRGEIKSILTNQSFIAGIGNAYADEILFDAGIYPFRKKHTLAAKDITAVYNSVRSVLTNAIQILRTQVGTEIQTEHRDFLKIHGKIDKPCPQCGRPIAVIRKEQQLTYFCRNCQPGTLFKL